ncbi:MAG: hypothetical protein N2645_21625 [Clostridia bacterium]|nr:hypothetical protein [Clostridia bacterium]
MLKSDTVGASLSCETTYAALVAPQHCHILHMSKSNLSLSGYMDVFNVQFMWMKCSISAVNVFNG